jgi:DNA-binding NtrC family response regulator
MSISVPVPQLVLFVDDETFILTSLKRMLHPLRHEMQCEFASNGTEALARLAAERFDIIVADMRTPVMDGAKLLGEVQRLHPHIIRLALSGHADLDTAMSACRWPINSWRYRATPRHYAK